MSDTKESITEQIRELQRRRGEIDAVYFESYVFPRIQKLIGLSLAYRNNSYSCPDKPSGYWDAYRRVLRVVKSGSGAWVIFEECSIDRDKKPSLGLDAQFCTSPDWSSGWARCDANEYDRKKSAVLAAIASPDDYAERFSR